MDMLQTFLREKIRFIVQLLIEKAESATLFLS